MQADGRLHGRGSLGLDWIGLVAVKRKNPDVLLEEESILEGDARWTLASRVARSPALYRATQLRDILLFIVRQAVLQPEEPIHEFEIAHRVLGRRSDFNPLDDNIVRVQMAHLRKKLEIYFSTEGKDEEVVITVAMGTYKPVFSPRSSRPAPGAAAKADAERREAAAAAAPGAVPAAMPAAIDDVAVAQLHEVATVPGNRRGPVLWVAAVALILVLGGGCAALWMRVRSERQALDQIQQTLAPWRYQPAFEGLWSGFFDSGRDTDVVLSDDSFLLIEEISKQQTPFYGYLGRSYLGSQESEGLSPQLKFVQELLAAKSLGNTSEFKLAQRILALDPLEKKVHLYSARQYMPALVKQDNVILIGGRISNPWSELFEGR